MRIRDGSARKWPWCSIAAVQPRREIPRRFVCAHRRNNILLVDARRKALLNRAYLSFVRFPSLKRICFPFSSFLSLVGKTAPLNPTECVLRYGSRVTSGPLIRKFSEMRSIKLLLPQSLFLIPPPSLSHLLSAAGKRAYCKFANLSAARVVPIRNGKFQNARGFFGWQTATDCILWIYTCIIRSIIIDAKIIENVNCWSAVSIRS